MCTIQWLNIQKKVVLLNKIYETMGRHTMKVILIKLNMEKVN